MRVLNDQEKLTRAAQGESVLRDDAFNTYYAERMEELIDSLLVTAPGDKKAMDIHREMVVMQEVVQRLYSWHTSGVAVLEDRNNERSESTGDGT